PTERREEVRKHEDAPAFHGAKLANAYPRAVPDRTLLVVSHRPLDAGGGGSVRWRHLRRVLPHHGWRVVECSPPAGATAKEMSTDPRAAQLARRRARVMAVAGRIVDPLAWLLRV